MGAQPLGREPPNRQRRPLNRQRWNDGVHARAVGQARVDHRTRFVDAAPNQADDALDDPQQVRIVLEDDVAGGELTLALDVHLIETVHENVGDAGIFQQRFEWPKAEQLVQHILFQRLAFKQAQRRLVLTLEYCHDQITDFRLGLLAFHARETIEVQPVQQLLVDPAFQFLIVRVPDIYTGGVRHH